MGESSQFGARPYMLADLDQGQGATYGLHSQQGVEVRCADPTHAEVQRRPLPKGGKGQKPVESPRMPSGGSQHGNRPLRLAGCLIGTTGPVTAGRHQPGCHRPRLRQRSEKLARNVMSSQPPRRQSAPPVGQGDPVSRPRNRSSGHLQRGVVPVPDEISPGNPGQVLIEADVTQQTGVTWFLQEAEGLCHVAVGHQAPDLFVNLAEARPARP